MSGETLIWNEDQFRTSSADAAWLQDLFDEARTFLGEFKWCRGISRLGLGLHSVGIFGVFCAEIQNTASPADNRLWVVVGDLPPAYIVVDDAPTSREALARYIEEMQRWVDAVRSGNMEIETIPVNVPATVHFAEMLENRLRFLRQHFL